MGQEHHPRQHRIDHWIEQQGKEGQAGKEQPSAAQPLWEQAIDPESRKGKQGEDEGIHQQRQLGPLKMEISLS
jgi:hypothetical protein